MNSRLCVCQIVFLLVMLSEVKGHAYMDKPVGRAPWPYYRYCGDDPYSVQPSNFTCSTKNILYIEDMDSPEHSNDFSPIQLANFSCNNKWKVSYTNNINVTCDCSQKYCNCKPALQWWWSSVLQNNTRAEKCGVCGDIYNATKVNGHWIPSATEYGGLYGTFGPTGVYREGQLVNTVFYFPNPHKGFSEIRVCNNSAHEVNNQTCFDAHLLSFTGNWWSNHRNNISFSNSFPTRIAVTTFDRPINESTHEGEALSVYTEVILPMHLFCEKCTVQFTYISGREPEPQLQQVFRTCADIRIVQKDEPVVRLKSIGMSTNKTDFCFGPVSSTNYTQQIVPCDMSNNTIQSVIGTQPWKDFGTTYGAIVFESSDQICLSEVKGNPNYTQIRACSRTLVNQKWIMIPTHNDSTVFLLQNHDIPVCLKARCPTKDEAKMYPTACNQTNPNELWTLH